MNTIGTEEFMHLVRAGSLESGASAGADDAVLLSIAISMKRIADTLEEAAKPTIEGEAVGSRCRICGCTWDNPCPEGCGWYDPEQTLCDNPECLKKAGVIPAGIGGSDS